MTSTKAKTQSEWWRWAFVPFVGVIGGTLGALAFGLIQWLGLKLQGGFSEDGWYFLYILPTITSGIFGYVFVTVTHYVAPRGKFISSVVMTTILGLFLALSVVLAWGLLMQSTGESIKATVGCIASLVASVFTLINIAQTDGTSA